MSKSRVLGEGSDYTEAGYSRQKSLGAEGDGLDHVELTTGELAERTSKEAPLLGFLLVEAQTKEK